MASLASWLQPWHDFFLLIGGASATLLGLVFVASSIAGAVPNDKLGTSETRALWTMPIIAAFGRPLAIAAVGLLPGLTLEWFGAVLSGLAAADLIHLILVTRGLIGHHRRVRDLVASDWVWNVALPIGFTLLVLAAALTLVRGEAWAMYALAAAMAFHLAIGVHNAWELMDFLVTLQ